MHHEKLTEAVTVKLSDTDKCFAVSRAHQKGMESASEYLRWLLTLDREQARQEYTLSGWRWGERKRWKPGKRDGPEWAGR